MSSINVGFVGPLPPYPDPEAEYHELLLSHLSLNRLLNITCYIRQRNAELINDKITYKRLPLFFNYSDLQSDGKLPDIFHLEFENCFPGMYVERFFNTIKNKGHPIISALHEKDYGKLKPILIRSYRATFSEPSAIIYNINAPKTEEILQYSEKVIVFSKYMKNVLSKEYPIYSDKIQVIPLIVDIDSIYINKFKDEVKEALSIDPETFVIVSFGYLTPGKGFEEVIKAVSVLRGGHNIKNVKYFIIGGHNFLHYKLKLNYLIKKLELENVVKLCGYLPFDEVKLYLKAADVIVQPRKGRVEEASSSLLTAMASGTPVITNASEDYIENGKTGFVVDYSAEKFANKIIYLYENRDIGKKIGKRTVEWCRDNVSPNIIANEYIKLYGGLHEN